MLCLCPVVLSLLIHFQQVLWVLKLLLSPGLGSWLLEFKSLITVILVFFLNFEFLFVTWPGLLILEFIKINTLEEIEILKAASSKTCSMMSSQDKMIQYTNCSPHHRFELQDQPPRPSMKQNLKTNNYNNQWFKFQLSTAQVRRQKWLQHPQDLLIMLL